MPSNIKKLYLSNFLVGLVFWYGIEKLFMQSINIDAVGIGIAAALLLVFNLLFDIPSGIMADKWSRKGMLLVAVAAMALCSLILGLSNSLAPYLLGYILYGVYVVSTSGTYQALVYDSLHEKGLSGQYSKIMGRAYAIFLVGAGVANLASGFLAEAFDFRLTFFISVVPCVLNMLVIASIKEPSFHKAEQKQRVLGQIKQAFSAIAEITLLRGLAIILTTLAVVELFKGDFGQLYMLQYTSSPEIIGVLWAGYAFTWALGSVIAHRLRTRLNGLVFVTILPLVFMSFIDSWVGLIFFMVQATASAALLNQIETRVQEATPSAVRASILSVLSSLGRGISIPASIAIGWIIHTYHIMWALYAVTGLGVLILLYWLWLKSRISQADRLIKADVVTPLSDTP
jgi:predicted MFS family arabinose efflux permease